MQNDKTRPPVSLLVAILFALIVTLHIGSALAGRSLFRPIHLGTALEYARGPIDLMRPIIVGFSANEAPVAEEVPFWQAAVLFKITICYVYYSKEMSDIIRAHTTAQDKLVIYGGDWGGEELFRSGRRGFYILSPQAPDRSQKSTIDLLNTPQDLHRLKELGYNKLVLISESPTRFAAVAKNPGSKRKRDYYPRAISPTIDSWPVIYQSEDILIKDIP